MRALALSAPFGLALLETAGAVLGPEPVHPPRATAGLAHLAPLTRNRVAYPTSICASRRLLPESGTAEAYLQPKDDR